jgi:hypothetical protein
MSNIKPYGLKNMATRLDYRGGFPQQDRMIRDKRKSMDRATLYSYQGAQVKEVNGMKMFENGHICGISANGIDKWSEGVMFLHYSEPLNTMLSGDKFFAVNLDEECPRLVQLIPGDEWMCTMDYESLENWTEVSKHIAKITKTKGWYGVNTMADGTEAYHYIYLG